MEDISHYRTPAAIEQKIQIEEEKLQATIEQLDIIELAITKQGAGDFSFLVKQNNLKKQQKQCEELLDTLKARQIELSANPLPPAPVKQSDVPSPMVQQRPDDENGSLIDLLQENEEPSGQPSAISVKALPGIPPQPSPPTQPPLSEHSIPANSPDLRGTGKHWAVIVGISTYEEETSYSPLKTCDKDAETFYELLVTRSFHPSRLHLFTDQTLTRPHNEKILARLQTTAQATMPDDLLLFFYSGLADEDNNDGYLITRNSIRQELQRTAIPIQQVKEIILDAPAHAKIIILDICHARMAASPANDEQITERFIYRIYDQMDGLLILSVYKEQNSYLTQSLLTSLLKETFTRLNMRQLNGSVTVQDICQELKNRIKLFLSLPLAATNTTIFYRYDNQTANRYLASVYVYTVTTYQVLQDIQRILANVATVYQSTCERLLKALYRINDPPPSETIYATLPEAFLKDSVYKVYRFTVALRKEIIDMRGLCQSSTVEAEEMHQSILSRLTNFMSEIDQIASKLRKDLLPGEIDE